MKDLSITQKRCLELAYIIRADTLPELVYDQEAFRDRRDCSTAACIAGYAVAAYDPSLWTHPDTYDTDIEFRARDLLGLSYEDSRNLFWGHYSATREQAAAVLEVYARTGKVKWR